MASRLDAEFERVVAALRLVPQEVPQNSESLERSRRKTEAWTRQYALAPDPTVRIAERPGRYLSCRPQDWRHGRHVFFLHGGGLVYYSASDYAGVVSHWARLSGAWFTALTYPKAPEHSFDQIFRHVSGSIEQRLEEIPADHSVVLAGDSVGAYLALAVCSNAASGRFCRLVMIYPVIDLYEQRPSYQLYGRGYLLNANMMSWFQRLARSERRLTGFSPFGLTPAQLRALPDIHLYSSEFDVLRNEAFCWVSYLREGGNAVCHEHFDTLPHNFCLYAGKLERARQAVERIAASFR